MILRMLTLMLALTSSLPLFAGGERAKELIGTIGGTPGAAGIAGIAGLPGAPGNLDFAYFYTLQGAENPPIMVSPVNPFAISFPHTGPSGGSGLITEAASVSGSIFTLTVPGTYLIQFQVDITTAGQLMLTLNGALLPYTVATKTFTTPSQIVGVVLVTTVTSPSFIQLINPPGNAAALTIPASDGGANPIVSQISFTRIQ